MAPTGWAGVNDAAVACAAAATAAAEQRERLQALCTARRRQVSVHGEVGRLHVVAAAAREQALTAATSPESERLRSMLASVRLPGQLPSATMAMKAPIETPCAARPTDSAEEECVVTTDLEQLYDDDWIVLQ
mmetsp:Transcript_76573/g.224777  ORF Transcript_76573/g.224777 Transcript_76573/m.224777 type:complete len:132 (+) Transcript_76573:58-453(+)